MNPNIGFWFYCRKYTIGSGVSKTTLILLAFLQTSCVQKKKQGDVNFNQIRTYALAHWGDSLASHSTPKSFTDFDFEKFEPRTSTNHDKKVEVFYAADGGGIEKIHRCSILPSDDFEFTVTKNDKLDCIILYIEQYHKGLGVEQVNGFILIYKSTCYFVSFEDPLRVMKLDKDLKVIATLRFESIDAYYAGQL